MKLIEVDDRWIIPLAGEKVTRCLVDYSFTLEILEQNYSVAICLEAEFVLKISDRIYNLSPANPTELGTALTMLHKNIKHAEAFKNGRLEITFEDDISLSLEPDNYEAWQVTSHDGSMIISLPGGGLAIFGNRDG